MSAVSAGITDAATIQIDLIAIKDIVIAGRCHADIVPADSAGTISRSPTALRCETRCASRPSAIRVCFLAVLDSISAGRGLTSALQTIAIPAIVIPTAAQSVYAGRTIATAVQGRLVSVLDAVIALRLSTGALGTHLTHTIGGVTTLAARYTWIAIRAAIRVRLGTILYPIITGCPLADTVCAHLGTTIGGLSALLSHGTDTTIGPTTVDVGFILIP